MGLHKGQINSGSFKKGHIPHNKGKKYPMTVKTKRKISKANKGRVSHRKGKTITKEHKNKIRLSCLNNPKMRRKFSESHKKILSNYAKTRIGKKASNWQGGKSFESYPLGWTKTFKEQIRYRDGYKCKLCGIPEVECYRKLDVHHIDYDKENTKPENLISLCKSCHSKTNNNRKYWRNILNAK